MKRVNNYNFVVDSYSNAANIEDCLHDSKITEELMEICKKLSLKEGAIYILDALCNKPVEMRPFHCSDANRFNYIVRSQDEWKVDAGGEQIKTCINPIVTKIYDNIYGEKMSKMENMDDVEYRMSVCETMATELTTHNIEKQCAYAVKASANNYIINFNLLR